MAGFSDYLEGRILDHVLQAGTMPYVAPSQLFVALHNADPGDDGIGFEFAGRSYERKLITFNPSSEGPVVNTAAIPWVNLPTGIISWIVVYDAAENGNPLFIGQLATPKPVGDGDSFTVGTGRLAISLD